MKTLTACFVCALWGLILGMALAGYADRAKLEKQQRVVERLTRECEMWRQRYGDL